MCPYVMECGKSTLFDVKWSIFELTPKNFIFRIDITVDNSIRLLSCAGQIIVSLSSKGDASAVKHPNGSVQQIDKFVQIIAHDQSENNNTYVQLTLI